jgi:hypothetical protein
MGLPLQPGLTPGANVSGTNISVPFAPQTGGQATLGGTINPLLPVTFGGGGGSYPTLPQGPVSTGSSTGILAPLPTGTPTMPGGGSTNRFGQPISQAAGAGGGGGSATTTTGFPANNSPYGTSTAPGAGGGGGVGSILGSNLNPSAQTALARNLEKTFGRGIGALIMQFLQGGAGYNQQAINNLINQLQPQFKQQQQDLLQQFSATGNRFGSGAEIGLSNLMSQQGLEIGSLETQMYEQAVNNYMQILMGAADPTAKRILSQPQPGIFDQIGSALGLVGSGSQAASGIVSAINPSADTGVLDAVGLLAA